MMIDPADPRQFTRLHNAPGPPTPRAVARLHADLAAARDPRDPMRGLHVPERCACGGHQYTDGLVLTCLACGATTPEADCTLPLAGPTPPPTQLALWEDA